MNLISGQPQASPLSRSVYDCYTNHGPLRWVHAFDRSLNIWMHSGGDWVWSWLPCFAVHRDCLSARVWLFFWAGTTPPFTRHPAPKSEDLGLAFFGTRGSQKLECAINCLGSVFGRRQLSKIWLVFSLINAQVWNINYTCVRVLNLLGGHFLENLLKTNSRRDSPFFLKIYAIVFMC